MKKKKGKEEMLEALIRREKGEYGGNGNYKDGNN